MTPDTLAVVLTLIYCLITFVLWMLFSMSVKDVKDKWARLIVVTLFALIWAFILETLLILLIFIVFNLQRWAANLLFSIFLK